MNVGNPSEMATMAAERITSALSDAQYFESSMIRPQDIRTQLNSKSIKEKIDALKRILALISLGKDASGFFPDVVKNVISTSLEVKRLVYLYLVHYAEEKPDLALLSINAFQKDLSDPNPLIRALSLRVLSSIRVRVILQIVIMAVNKGAKDSSQYVRKVAAHAVSKVYSLEPECLDELLEPLVLLLADKSTAVLGSAIAAYREVVPDRYDLLHPHYRKLCRGLLEIDEWGQVFTIDTLTRYVRANFTKPEKSTLDPDITLLINAASPLFHSNNGAVVISTVALYYHLLQDKTKLETAVRPLIRLVRRDPATEFVALHACVTMAEKYPALFTPYLSEFFVFTSDGEPIVTLKIKVLSILARSGSLDRNTSTLLLTELKAYLYHSSKPVQSMAAQAIGNLAISHPNFATQCVRLLSSLVSSSTSSSIVTESINVLRVIIQQDPAAHLKSLKRLAAMLVQQKIDAAEAKACIIWLIGQVDDLLPSIGPEICRIFTKTFPKEEPQVKTQIILLATKLALLPDSHMYTQPLPDSFVNMRWILLDYLLKMASLDKSIDVRDLSRYFSVAINQSTRKLNPSYQDHMIKALLEKKAPPRMSAAAETSLDNYVIIDPNTETMMGTLIHILGQKIASNKELFKPLPAWAQTASNPSLRHEPDLPPAYIPEGIVSIGAPGTGTGFGSGSGSGVGMGSDMFQHIAGGAYHPGWAGSSSGIGSASIRTAGLGATRRQPHFVNPETFYDDQDDSTSEYESGSDYETESEQEGQDQVYHPHQTQQAHTSNLVDMLGNQADDILNNNNSYNNDNSAVSKPQPEPHSSVVALKDDWISAFASMTGHESSTLDDPDDGETRRLIESWNCDGLEISYKFSYNEQNPHGLETTLIKLDIKNDGKDPISNLMISKRSQDQSDSFDFDFTPALKVMPFETIPSVNVGETIKTNLYLQFPGKNVPVTLNIAFTKVLGTRVEYPAEIRPSIGDIFRPEATMTVDEFRQHEKELAGMFTLNKEINVDGVTAHTMSVFTYLTGPIQEDIKKVGRFATIGGAYFEESSQNETASMRFAARVCGIKKLVLVVVSLENNMDRTAWEKNHKIPCKLRVMSEEPLCAAGVMQIVSSKLSQQK